MKRMYVLPMAVFAVIAVLVASCVKNSGPSCTPYSLAQDRHIIDSFVDRKSLPITFNSTFNAYTGVTAPGTGSAPASDSLIKFKYSLSLMDGTVIGTTDTLHTNNNGAALKLSDLNPNSVEFYALSSLKKSGTFKVIVPSSLSVGCSSTTINNVTVPAYSQLIYDYTLIDVKANTIN